MASLTNGPRLLLLMTTITYRAGAFLEAAQRLNVSVVVGSERPQVLAAAHPSGHLTLDFVSPEKPIPKLLEFHHNFPIDAVIAADDDGAILAARAAQALGLRHNPVDAVAAARNKHRMREIMSHAGISSPTFAAFSISEDPELIARRVPYPCVIKPLSLSASRGVIRADNPDQFVAAFRRVAAILRQPQVAATTGDSAQTLLVEDFIPGDEIALEGLLTNGELRVLAIFDKPDPLDGPFFEETIYVTPSRLPVSSQKQIVECATTGLHALGLRHGPVHVEVRLNERGAWIIEIAPRSIGGLCSRTLRFGDGLSLEELILRHAIGLEVALFNRESCAAGVMMIPIPHAGVLREVRGQQEARQIGGIEDVRIAIPIGLELVPLPEGTKYLGFIFARAATPAQVEAALREAHRLLRFVID